MRTIAMLILLGAAAAAARAETEWLEEFADPCLPTPIVMTEVKDLDAEDTIPEGAISCEFIVEVTGLSEPAYLVVLPREGETVSAPWGSYRVRRVEHVLVLDVARGPLVPPATGPVVRIWVSSW